VTRKQSKRFVQGGPQGPPLFCPAEDRGTWNAESTLFQAPNSGFIAEISLAYSIALSRYLSLSLPAIVPAVQLNGILRPIRPGTGNIQKNEYGDGR
jgi:hypothetical protein